MSKMYNVRISDELADKVEEMSHATERSKSYIVRKALEIYAKDYYDYQLALDRLRDKDDKIISSDDMRKKLGI
ncbi:MAG TPA: ribbon-helix-helix protein, CopG family [Firmicutes bacterium]|nr:ribbon-helix-helix protein, CopG family [Bacillota bacterium]